MSRPRCRRRAADRGHRVVRHAEGAGEHVGRAAGEHAERGVGAGDAGGHLVERAVAAEADHHVEPAAGGVLGEAGGVTATVRLDDLDVSLPRDSARWTTTVLRAVTELANALTTSRIRKAPTVQPLPAVRKRR
jgi:hypothetical protein